MIELFSNVKDFLENNEACKHSLLSLKEPATLVLIIDKRASISVYKKRNHFEVKQELAKDYDVLLRMDADSYRRVIQNKNIQIADLGILLLQQIVVEKIEVEFQSSLLKLIRRGYFKIALLAGSPFLGQLSYYGFSQMNKIYAWVEAKRKL